GADAAGLLVTIERQRVVVDLRTPERCVETLGQPSRLGIKRVCSDLVAEQSGAAGSQTLGGVHVALYFGEGDRRRRGGSVGVEDGIEGILPTLIDEAVLAGALVFQEAIAIGVSRAVDPCQRSVDRGPQRLERLQIPGPFHV